MNSGMGSDFDKIFICLVLRLQANSNCCFRLLIPLVYGGSVGPRLRDSAGKINFARLADTILGRRYASHNNMTAQSYANTQHTMTFPE